MLEYLSTPRFVAVFLGRCLLRCICLQDARASASGGRPFWSCIVAATRCCAIAGRAADAISLLQDIPPDLEDARETGGRSSTNSSTTVSIIGKPTHTGGGPGRGESESGSQLQQTNGRNIGDAAAPVDIAPGFVDTAADASGGIREMITSVSSPPAAARAITPGRIDDEPLLEIAQPGGDEAARLGPGGNVGRREGAWRVALLAAARAGQTGATVEIAAAFRAAGFTMDGMHYNAAIRMLANYRDE